ncbi:MAG: DEAD/DEAH box helicase [Prevotellaceae bacterium]|nr:DEAD/DEAH box helicase [Candidatus Minthosoma caballi]
MTIFDKYEKLSEDAQRLLCFYVSYGLGANKRMSEHLYVLTKYCFTTFNGEAALQELLEHGIMREDGRDWYLNSTKYEVNDDDVVPALWYMYDKRKDLATSFIASKQTGNQQFQFVRLAVKEMVENDNAVNKAASAIHPDQAKYFFSIAEHKECHSMISVLSSETFIALCKGLVDYWIEHDKVCDSAPIASLITQYPGMTEATRYRLLALFDLYQYIATGNTPSEGVFQGVPEGQLQVALTLMNAGNNEIALNIFSKLWKQKAGVASTSECFDNPIIYFYFILSLIHYRQEASKQQLRLLVLQPNTASNSRFLPGKIVGEDYLEINKRLHHSQLMQMYDNAIKGEIPVIYQHFAFMLCSYFGYSSSSMIADECIPNLALLRHEMLPFITLPDGEKEMLNELFGDVQPLNSIPHKAVWQNIIDELTREALGETPEQKATEDIRLMYIRQSMDTDVIVVREQTRLKNGSWGNGKVLAESKYKQGDLPYMNEADHRILARRNSSGKWSLTLSDVIEEMVGDKRLYFGNNAPFELVKVDKDTPYIIVEKENGHFVVKSNVSLSALKNNPVIIENSPTHYSVINIPAQVRSWYERLLSVGSFPLSAEESLREFLPTIGGKVEVHSSLIEGGSTLPIVDGNSNIGFKLSPRNNGNYDVEVFVRPLQGGNRTYKPAWGDNIIIDENEEGRVRVSRNMKLEEVNLSVVKGLWESEGVDFEYHATYSPEFVLELIQFIQRAPEMCFAEWPEGQNMRVRTLTRGASSWNGVLKARGQWFEIEGDVKIDDNTVVSISQLLDLIGKSKGKFIKLNDFEFIALSEKLKMQLRSLEALANKERGKIRISPFSAALMSEDLLFGEITFEMDKQLYEIRERILESSSYSPEIPKELNATLRPYQVDGYQWIARLNSWGAGALLADDMGLGKTIQTIAFLLLKKEEGPSLVVAPASVAPNWKTELDKFAPCLNSQILNFATNRRAMIENAKAGDVVITTYGILLSIQDEITKKNWNVACLDEAHIIKNRGAKTSAAAMKIQATNRVMLTGTPVQNHLGELWSLFQFVNPGMLGNYDNFSQKFIIPIEGYQDKEKQQQLDRIVHPFMLRRTKQAVLKELPEKTEIYHEVNLTNDEMAVYESIRTRAEKMLADNMTTKGGGSEVDMNVLAEITRLRQAACSAQLIEPKWSGECSKITTLAELLQGVIEGGNRALVFSQFVGFFDLIKPELDKRGMQYFYIDGSVPVKKRTEMVIAFQEGECSIFLISLKAGGLGLNLTGANYVFHLDPWWNPAIEQQATDRAYRIGQNQAVTVYHLVSKNTIEEKIIRLHQTKRDLADNLLDGTDISHKLTGKDLLEMVMK